MASYSSDDDKLDFAYKYPFSQESKGIILKAQQRFDLKGLENGRKRVQDAIDKKLEFRKIPISSIKLTYLISYAYARMIVSCIRNTAALNAYADSEAHRSAEALMEGTQEEVKHLADELGIHISGNSDQFAVRFEEYISNIPRSGRFSLSKQPMARGSVHMNIETAIGLVENAMRKEILKGLPIPLRELPREAVESAKAVKLPAASTGPALNAGTASRYLWIEKLLQNPIPDVRHRSVNLILAPYLVNVKGLSEEDAVKVINAYIDRCREINPDTKINLTYIRYQCRYAKEKGMKPLSLEKARTLIGMHVDIG
ncbi:MAG: DNA primase noncatalytic subunit PriX [Candidatus Marsarchaeota archaeon]|jgi:hypothetical protein|nr:DNA primase noncatalytic subunit PriX [Candidatus Marsarchaeota archaeon]